MASRIDIDLTGAGSTTATGTASDEQAELKRTLAKRMGLAVVLIAVLLAALAVVDRISQPDAIEAPPPRPPVPLARQEVANAMKPATSPGTAEPPPVVVEKASAAGPSAAVPPAVEPPPKPEVQAQPSVSGPPAALPAPAVPARSDARPAAPRAPVVKAQSAPVAESSAPAIALPPTAAELAPAPAIVPAVPATRLPPVAPRLFAGYMLQAGVFSSALRAEELHARLQLNGIPSTMEARVQVGPFKTRAEADAAREKLKSLGIESVLLAPPRGAGR